MPSVSKRVLAEWVSVDGFEGAPGQNGFYGGGHADCSIFMLD
jgi:hypothetical protein